jgi:hypothetical protein
VPLTGVVSLSAVFSTPGTWLVRGATIGDKSTAAGYTSVLTVTVS